MSEIIFLTCLGCKKVREAKAHIKAHITSRQCIRTKQGRRILKEREMAKLANNRRLSIKRKRSLSGSFVLSQNS